MSGPDFVTGSAPATPPKVGGAEFTAAMLQETLNIKKIAAIVALAWDGPQWTSFNVSLGLGQDPKQVVALADALAFAAGATSCRVSKRPGGLTLEIPKPEGERQVLPAERLAGLRPATTTAVPLGVSTGGKVVWLDFADERFCHVVYGGSTGSGKSVLTHWSLFRLFTQNHLGKLRALLLDPKTGELDAFSRVPHLLHPVVSNPFECGRVLNWAVSELHRRMASRVVLPRILIVVEEVADLATTSGILPAIERIAQVGRTAGMHLLLTAQQPGAKSLGSALVNVKARAIGQVTTGTLTYGGTGRAGTEANELLGRGDFVLISAGQVVRFQAPWMPEGMLAKLPQGVVGDLSDRLPTVALLADLQRDKRGGRGRKELTDGDYRELETALANGATADELSDGFGIGWERSKRMVEAYRAGQQPRLEGL